MSFIKNLVKTVQLVGKKNYRQVTECINITYSVTQCLNRSIAYDVSEKKENSNFQKYNRFQSTLYKNNTQSAQEITIWEDMSRDFMGIFPDLIRDLSENVKHSDADVSKWLEKVLQYNLYRGKRIRGVMTVLSYKLLEKPENLTSENLHLAKIMGWCVEMMLTYICMLDDIMDRSTMRHNVSSWHLLPGIGLTAVNDSFIIQSSMYFALKKNFQGKSYYKDVLNVFNEITLKVTTGQYLDMTACKRDKPDLSNFTMDRYNTIIKYKTAYIALLMPVQLAMLMCGIDSLENRHHHVRTILLEIGQFSQIQNDFFDCFRNRTGTDIQEGKCTWLSVVALQRVTPAQKLLMEKFYGSMDPEHVAIIKHLYEKLDIRQEYTIYKETTYKLLRIQIQENISGLSHELFFKILDKIFQRNTLDRNFIV